MTNTQYAQIRNADVIGLSYGFPSKLELDDKFEQVNLEETRKISTSLIEKLMKANPETQSP